MTVVFSTRCGYNQAMPRIPDTDKQGKKRSLTLWLCLLLAVACGPAHPTEPPTATATGLPGRFTPQPGDVHHAEGAGKWYPADPAKLRAAVEAFLAQADVEPPAGRLLAVIVPHAGYLYSGAVSGYAFRALQAAGCAGQTLAVVGDTHTGHGSADVAVWAAGAFETPLGTLPVDQEVAQALLTADKRIEFDRNAFRSEHPVENQLPFIQVACPGARIVPVVIRRPSPETAQFLAEALVRAFGRRPALIVASTDLSHYHSYDEAQQMDRIALQAIASLDPQAVADSPRRCAELGLGGREPLTMCSQGAVMTALIAVRQMSPKGTGRATVLHYANSGDTPIGDRSQVVGYGAVALWQGPDEPQPPTPNLQPPTPNPQPVILSPQQQKELLTLARRTIAQYLESETFPAFQTDDPALLQPLGAYVTYEKNGALRGCLGRLEGDRPAYLNVQYAAVAAALADPRFPPVTADELPDLTIEITLLEPLHQVESPDQIRVGRDGVLLRVGQKQGALYLPQVAPEQGWDLAATLLNLCRKAGLADDCWRRSDARLYTFGGQWFGEGREEEKDGKGVHRRHYCGSHRPSGHSLAAARPDRWWSLWGLGREKGSKS